MLDIAGPALLGTAAINLALALGAGLLAARRWLGADPPAMRAVLLACWCAVAAATLLLLLDQAARLTETPLSDAWKGAMLLAAETFSGRAMASVGAAAALAALLTGLARRHAGAIALTALGSISAMRAATGHAGDAGIASLPVLVEWAHLLATSLWTGCVAVSGWMVLAALRGPAQLRYAECMSRWATGALAVIVASGVFNTGRMLGAPADLLDTDYGRLLLAKIGLVLAAMGLGAVNRLHGLPALRRQPSGAGALRRFLLVLRIESPVLAAIVLLAAVLTNTAPHG